MAYKAPHASLRSPTFPAGEESEESFRSIVSSRWIQGERWRSARIATFKKTRGARASVVRGPDGWDKTFKT